MDYEYKCHRTLLNQAAYALMHPLGTCPCMQCKEFRRTFGLPSIESDLSHLED